MSDHQTATSRFPFRFIYKSIVLLLLLTTANFLYADGTVSGKMVDAADGTTPVHPVDIDLLDPTSGEALGYFARNNPDGTYEITGIPAGDYKILFNAFDAANGYTDELYDEIPCDDGVCDRSALGTVIQIADSTFELNEDLTRGLLLSGRVTNENGAPFADVVIAVLDQDGLVVDVSTDQDGDWSAPLTQSGTYYVETVGESTPGYVPEVWNNHPCEVCNPSQVGDPIVVTDKGIGGIDFRLEKKDTGDGDDPPIFHDMRAVHMGGNWGATRIYRDYENNEASENYIQWLKSIHVNWVGISIALHVTSSDDSDVRPIYHNDPNSSVIPTFTDAALTQMVQRLRDNGFHVYLTLAFEIEPNLPDKPVSRGFLGTPKAHEWAPEIKWEDWPWALDHPNHDRFVSEFWQSYTAQAVHFATLAESLGVELFSLGTETEGLFRTRSDENHPNHYKNELQRMVSAVRNVYSGLLTYDMLFTAFGQAEAEFGEGTRWLWQDAGLDVIGISSYFALTETEPTSKLSYEQLKSGFEQVFANYLTPLQHRNPGIPIMFLEFGYMESIRSPYVAFLDTFTERIFTDDDDNGLDDGAETQADAYRAMFEVNEAAGRLVKAAFFWEHDWTSDQHWNELWGPIRHFGVRDKLAEDVLKAEYSRSSQVNTGHSGAWYNPQTAGQGVLLDVEPVNNFLFLSWFTYTDDTMADRNEQHWFTAQGNYSGDTAQLTVYETLGGLFDDPKAPSTAAVGTMELSFSDCANALVNYTIDSWGVAGSFPLTRAVPETENVCLNRSQTANVDMTVNDGWDGAWYDTDTPGQGFLFDVRTDTTDDDFIFAAWFTYGEDTISGQRWLTAQGPLTGTTAETIVYETTGGSFDDPKPTETVVAGSMTIEFTGCNNALVTYVLSDGALTGSIDIKRAIPGTEALCEELSVQSD